jgi:hypothetical protein
MEDLIIGIDQRPTAYQIELYNNFCDLAPSRVFDVEEVVGGDSFISCRCLRQRPLADRWVHTGQGAESDDCPRAGCKVLASSTR